MTDQVLGGRLRGLLLHELPPSEAEPLEEQLLQDGRLADLLQAEENDLLDDYVGGLLNSEDAARVEKYVLAAPAAQQRLAFARALAHVSREQHSSQRSWLRSLSAFASLPRKWQLAAGFAAGLLIVISAVLYFRYTPRPTTPRMAVAKATNPLVTRLAKSGAEYTIVLVKNQLRGSAGEASFAIPENAKWVRIQSEVPPQIQSEYRLLLKSTGGLSIKIAGLHSQKAAGIAYVQGTVAATELKPGIYNAAVYGRSSSPVVSFDFAIRRQ